MYIMDTNNPNTATIVWRWNMNGLGYSKNGIDGPYETAITSDGQIVADFITTGKLKTNVIEGYDQFVINVSNSINDINNNLSDMTYSFGTDALNISKPDSPNSAVINNNGTKLYTYDDLKLISNQNGTGVHKLIVTGDAQIGYLRFVKETDDNGNECTDIHHLVSNIQTLQDLEVENSGNV